MRRRVLIVDDDEVITIPMKKQLNRDGYSVQACNDAEEALKIFAEDPFPVIITDIRMPNMDGHQFIKKINEIDYDPIILVQSSVDDIQEVIDIMKNNVLDYLIKPLNLKELSKKVKLAFEKFEYHKLKSNIKNDKNQRLNTQMQILSDTNKIVQLQKGKNDFHVLKSLKDSFSQGLGFGGLVSIMSLIRNYTKKDGENYIISKDLIDILDANAKAAEKTLQRFESISKIIESKSPKVKMSLKTLKNITVNTIKENLFLAKVNNNKIKISQNKDFKLDKHVAINEEYFIDILKELLLNAFKFSKKDTVLSIILSTLNDKVIISFLNSPHKNTDGTFGIPQEYERLIFDPFFRLTKSVFEDFDTLDYGLGLTYVEKLVEDHNGTITGKNIEYHSLGSEEQNIHVEFELSLPLLAE